MLDDSVLARSTGRLRGKRHLLGSGFERARAVIISTCVMDAVPGLCRRTLLLATGVSGLKSNAGMLASMLNQPWG